MATQANIYEAKARLSELVDRAEKGEEVIIARAGKPVAKLVPMEAPKSKKKKRDIFGKNILGITDVAPDAFAPMTEEELKEWGL